MHKHPWKLKRAFTSRVPSGLHPYNDPQPQHLAGDSCQISQPSSSLLTLLAPLTTLTSTDALQFSKALSMSLFTGLCDALDICSLAHFIKDAPEPQGVEADLWDS